MKIEILKDITFTQGEEILQFVSHMEKTNKTRYKLDKSVYFEANQHATHLICRRADKITGYAVFSRQDPAEAEVTMLLPNDRKLFEAMMEKIKREAPESACQRILFIVNSSDTFQQDEIRQAGGSYSFSEYAMTFDFESLKVLQNTSEIFLEQGKLEEIKEIAELWDQEQEEVHLPDLEKTLVYRTEGKIASAIRIDETPCQFALYGFAVAPDFRGRGLGRRVLHQVLRQLAEKRKQIYLEVESENQPALKLYESSGFSRIAQFDYFEMKRPEHS